VDTVDEERLPVVVSAGQSLERVEVVSAVDLATRAAEAAFEGLGDLRRAIEVVSMVNILSPAPPDPASAVARRLGLSPQRAEVTTIGGNSPQWLVNRAAAAIAAGERQAVLVVGAEAQRSAKQAREAKQSRPATRPPGSSPSSSQRPAGSEPDPVIGDARSGVSAAELNAGLIAPVHVYAMFESVLAHSAGRDYETQRRALGDLMAPFTEVAAANPFAWFAESRRPEELATISPDNRLVAEPYPKRMCAVLNVDQGAAVVVTSLAAARRAGVEDRAVFCLAGAEANDVWFPSERPDPGASPGIAAAAAAALGAAGLGIDDVGSFDLYSCFPCVVQMAAAALGVAGDDSRGLTVTGGLPYFGGPGNNYTLHAIAAMTDRLRRLGGTGLVTGLGWYATKHSVGLYGSDPPEAGWRTGDTAPAQAAIDAGAVEVATEAEGPATVVAGTVVAGAGGSPAAAPVVARLTDGRHVAAAAEEDELASVAGCNLVGRHIVVSGPLPRYRLLG